MTRTLTGSRVEAGVLPVTEVKRAIAPHVDVAAELRPRLRKAIETFPRPSIGTRPAEHTWYLRRGKRMMDVALVLLAAPFILPVVMLTALALWLEGGMPFYHQDRMRADGTRYRILKLRTMVMNADKMLGELLANDAELRREWDETQKLKNDPRITRVGRVLRVTSLDELPQLWNVLTGEMSLIGPRPMLPDQVAIYDGPIYWGMRPGLSGLWQVSDRNDRNFDYRAEMDRVYRRKVSFREDVSIIFRTVGVMLKRTGY
ncbi:MAG: sugar transferase [Maritimibacter sp.]|nr:sugar transferase [Maritimibacter sp.]